MLTDRRTNRSELGDLIISALDSTVGLAIRPSRGRGRPTSLHRGAVDEGGYAGVVTTLDVIV